MQCDIVIYYSLKMYDAEIVVNKYEKMTTPFRTGNAVDPAKRGLEQMRIELAMLNFCPRTKQALPAHRAG
jgi:hypothetical protein